MFKKLQNLFEGEATRTMPLPNYLNKIQKGEITEAQRDWICEWLLSLNNQFGFSSETYFLAVHYFDRFLSMVKIKAKFIQLIAVTCFMIAAKVQEESEVQATLSELVTCSEYTFSSADLLRMEKIVLNKLSWDVNAVTPFRFLVEMEAALISCNLVPADSTLARDALELLEDCCPIYQFLNFMPSTLAITALVHEIKLKDSALAEQVYYFLASGLPIDKDAYSRCANDFAKAFMEVKPML
eukprot:Colp12_sorted_trinity150504_noHs@6542